MAPRIFPGIGLTGGYVAGESGWGDALNTNLLMLSVLANSGADDAILLADLPASPTDGQIFIVLDTPPAASIYARDNGVWVTLTPVDGSVMYSRSTDSEYRYVLDSWQIQSSDLPAFGPPAATMVLRVNEDGDGLEWVPANPSLPAYDITNSGWYLKVNSAGTALEWEEVPTLPLFDAGDANKVLKINGDGDTADWMPEGEGPPGADGADGADGEDGWSAELAVATDGERRVFQIAGWAGGTGTPPSTGQYIGATGLVATAAEAVDIRGPAGADTGGGGGAGAFIELTDVPANYSTFGGFLVAVNTAEDGLEFIDPTEILPPVAGNFGRVLEVVGTGVGSETGFAWRRPGRIDVIVVTDADKTLDSDEIGAYIRMESATGRNLNVPLDATDYMPNGTTFIIRQGGAGQVTVVPEGGVTIRSNATMKTRTDESTISLTKISDNAWDLSGDLEQI